LPNEAWASNAIVPIIGGFVKKPQQM
jgi:hypothetical protein